MNGLVNPRVSHSARQARIDDDMQVVLWLFVHEQGKPRIVADELAGYSDGCGEGIEGAGACTEKTASAPLACGRRGQSRNVS